MESAANKAGIEFHYNNTEDNGQPQKKHPKRPYIVCAKPTNRTDKQMDVARSTWLGSNPETQSNWYVSYPAIWS